MKCAPWWEARKVGDSVASERLTDAAVSQIRMIMSGLVSQVHLDGVEPSIDKIENVSHHYGFRPGHRFVDFGLMIGFPRPLGRTGTIDCTVAVSRRVLTSGRLSVLGDSIQTNLVCLPDPRRIFSGSGNVAP
jgi:hypothetical protein